MSTPISQIPADVLEKIEKLMNLSARGGTEAEAQAAFAKASQLMTKHGIEQHHLQEKKAQKQKPGIAQVNLQTPVYATERPYHLYVRQIIRHCFNVCVVKISYRHRSPDYYMLGSPEDCAFAGYVFEFLSKTFLRLVNKHLKEHNLPRTPRFFNGYWDGLRIGFCNAWDAAQRAQIKQDNAQSYATGPRGQRKGVVVVSGAAERHQDREDRTHYRRLFAGSWYS